MSGRASWSGLPECCAGLARCLCSSSPSANQAPAGGQHIYTFIDLLLEELLRFFAALLQLKTEVSDFCHMVQVCGCVCWGVIRLTFGRSSKPSLCRW